MQTLQQKREYTVAVLDPAGNVTAIVCSDVSAAERARVAAQILRLPELGIEQVAFLTEPRSGGEIRLEMMGGEFCGNALRCAGFYQALRNGAQGKSCVFAEISGADGVQPVMADTAEGTASTVMPLPLSVQPADWVDVQATRVTFAGITHFVIDCAQPDETLVQRRRGDLSRPRMRQHKAGRVRARDRVLRRGKQLRLRQRRHGRRAHGGLCRRHHGDRHRPAGRHARGRCAAHGRRGDGIVDRRRGAPDADADRHAAGSGGSAVLIRKLCLHIGA